MDDERLELQRNIIGHVNDDRAETIDARTLTIALGILRGEYVPFGEHDVAAVPVPYGRATQVVLAHEDGNLFPALTALVSVGENAERIVQYDEIARTWIVIADGHLSDVRCVEDEAPAYVRHRGDATTVCWGDDWEIPLPAGAEWRVGIVNMGVFDDAIRLIEVLDGATLLHYSDGHTSALRIDATNVTPPWRADAPLEWKIMRRDGVPHLEKHGVAPKAVGTEQTRVFESGGELFAVDWIEDAANSRNVVRSLLSGTRVDISHAHVTITDIRATDTRLVVTFLLRGREHDMGRRGAPQTMVLDRRTGTWPNERLPGEPVDERWHHTTRAKELGEPNDRVVLVEMARRDADDRVVAHGVRVVTDRGEIFYPLRGVAFETLQLVGDALWGWRHTPSGIILSRYPLPLPAGRHGRD
ncbi:hypothetical protein EBS80_00350 [bacterium]|nr:hypothetical protein [bacterium]